MAQRHAKRGYSTRENPNSKCLAHVGILFEKDGTTIVDVVQAKKRTILAILRRTSRYAPEAHGGFIKIFKGNWRRPCHTFKRLVHQESVS